jgi:hypothetical protein
VWIGFVRSASRSRSGRPDRPRVAALERPKSST